jgi:hypothetical protein
MIKFFRSLRKQLLLENRTAKYLTYAIGEIVLVVIGILIALQINTWSNEHDNRKLERTYLEALHFEITEDLQFYSNVADSLKKQKASAQHILRFLENPEAKITDSLLFINTFRNCADGENLTRTEVTWKELQSTGRLSLIRNKDLVRQLFEYYAFLEQFAFDFNKFPMERRYLVRKIEHEVFNMDEQLEFYVDWKQEQVPRNVVFENIRSNPILLDLVKSVLISSVVQLETDQKALVRANELQETINQTLVSK